MLKNKKVLLNFIILYFFSTLWSSPGWCAGPIDDLLYPPYPLTEKERATLGVVGITRGLYLPEAVFDTFAKGKGSGTEKGAVEGFLTAIGNMGPCSGAFCGVAALLWIATAGTVDAVYGGVKGHKDALPAEEVQKIEQSITELYTDLKLQNRISEKLLQTAHKKTTKKLVSINSYGPTATGEKVDYSVLKNIPIDSVLEISVVNFGFKTWPRELKPPNNTVIDDKDPLLSLFLNVGPRLIRLYDNKVLYQPRLEISSKFLKRSEWMANHTHAFFDEIESLLDASVDKISDDVFITFYLPGENESIFK